SFGRTRLRRVMPDGASGFFSRSTAVSSDIFLRNGKGLGCWIIDPLERSTLASDRGVAGIAISLSLVGLWGSPADAESSLAREDPACCAGGFGGADSPG